MKLTRTMKLAILLGVAVLLLALAACAAPATPQIVKETVVVKETVEVPVQQTVVVKETVEVQVQATPVAQECATTKDKYKIGFANLTEDIVFTQLVEQGIKDEAAKAGVDLVIADNKLDGATALANADNFILQGVNGVIEFQTDEKFGNVIMDKFRRENIPVIAIDIPMPGATFFGADNYRAGYMAGEAAAKWVNENWDGKLDAVVALELPQSGPIPAARLQGQLEGLLNNVKTKPADDMIFHLDSKNTQDEAFKVVSDTLPKIPDARHVVGININEGTALGTIAAFEAAGRKEDIVVVAQGADPSGQDEMVKEGSRHLGSTAYFPEKYGSYLIPAILDLLNCKPLPPAIYVDHVFITKDNLCQYYPEHASCK
ncbi:MAG: sugar ABC transporter substrate-binding protein [Caldilineales bacterium]|nr:sugar ABC transporter substrate-binding protein [Caldilineales bacterium]MCW5857588.1 sugar ABC transporter substrate-binding protein [Caldilineales bacterium]